MAPKQTITFTALPNGVADTPSGKKVRLSAFASPRLSNDSSTDSMDLSSFPDWVNWPSTPVTFSVKFGAAAPVPATPVGDVPSSQLWGMLFGGTTTLVPHAFDQALTETKIPLTY